ncbi:MAG TPA: HEAT repeat domain-containing protein [Planctomycetota bacterium]|nr:HEAT repeat domain-containing protein [Planctomycetota bacterium]
MQRSVILTALACVCAGSASPVGAQGVEHVVLESGARHEARRRTSQEGVVLATALGDVVVAKAQVASTAPITAEATAFAATVEGLHPDNVAGQWAAGRAAAGRGLWTAARAHVNRVLQHDADHAGARGLAASWAATFRLHPFEAGPEASDSKVVAAWFENGAADWVGAAMVVAKCKGRKAESLLRPALKAMKAPTSSVRWAAAQVLADLRYEPERIKPLYRAGLVDRSPPVRREAVRALRGTNDPVFVQLYAKNLAHAEQAVRMTAAEALGELGMAEAVEPLLAAASSDGRPPRSHIAVVTQRAYVKDFDVEVAQGAVIADPVVDVVQDGTVLDVGVVAIVMERRVYFSALRRITGRKLGDDVNAWRAALAAR